MGLHLCLRGRERWGHFLKGFLFLLTCGHCWNLIPLGKPWIHLSMTLQVRNHCRPLKVTWLDHWALHISPTPPATDLTDNSVELIRVRSSSIWQGLWGGLLAALHLAMWQMLALMGTHRKGASLTACPGFNGRRWEWRTECSRPQGRQQ